MLNEPIVGMFGIPIARSLRYEVVGLGTLGGATSLAAAINSAGVVTGYSETKPRDFHAFVYISGRMRDLGTAGYAGSMALAINDGGVVVGYLLEGGASGPIRAFYCRDGKIRELRGLSGRNLGEATGINRNGDIVGASTKSLANPGEAVLWRNYGERITRLGTLPGGKISEAVAINDEGVVVGASEAHGASMGHGFIWFDGTMHDLGTLGGTTSSALAVNHSRQVVGESQTVAGATHAVLWSRGSTTDLGTLPDDATGAESAANAINDSGVIVGRTGKLFADPVRSRAVIWRDGTIHDLNKCIAPDSGWMLTNAKGINNRGEIVGNGIFNGKSLAFLLRPV